MARSVDRFPQPSYGAAPRRPPPPGSARPHGRRHATGPAPRPAGRRLPTLRARLLAGEFQTRFVVLLGATALAILVLTVLS